MKLKIIFLLLLLSLSLLPHYHIILNENNSSNYILSSENNGSNYTSKTITNKIESKNSITSSKIVQKSDEKIDKSSNSINTHQNNNDNLRNIKILSDGEHRWDSDIEFSDVTLDSEGDPFSATQVSLSIDGDLTPNNVTSNEDGTFTITLEGGEPDSLFSRDDIGEHNYSIVFPNQDNGEPDFNIDCYVCGQNVTSGSFNLTDLIIGEFSRSNDDEIAPSDDIIFGVSFAYFDDEAVPLEIINKYNITYSITFNDDPEYNIVNKVVQAEPITNIIENYNGTLKTSVTISVAIEGEVDFIDMSFSNPNDQFQIETDWVFQLDDSISIGGVDVLRGNLDDETIKRLGQEIIIKGKFNATAEGVNASLWDDIPIDYSITTPGGVDISNTVNTFSNGSFVISFELTGANFPDPNDIITVTITNQDPNEVLNEEQKTTSFNFAIVGELKTLNGEYKSDGQIATAENGDKKATFIGGSLFSTNDGNELGVNGTVLDEFNVGAQNALVTVSITDCVSILVDPDTCNIIETFNTQTDEDGIFDFQFAIPNDFNVAQETFTVMLSVNVDDSDVWENPDNLKTLLYTFDYISFAQITADSIEFIYNDGGDNELDGVQESQLLNNTFVNTFHDSDLDYYYQITIRDIFDRVPYGLTLNLLIDEASSNAQIPDDAIRVESLTINNTNNGIFTFIINEILDFDLSTVTNISGSIFEYKFTIANNNFDIYDTEYGHSISIFGPDNVNINSNLIDIVNDINFNNSRLEGNNSINVILDITGLENYDIQNIRNVTIYWRATTEGGYNDTTIETFNFTEVSWNIQNMTYNAITDDFNFTINFADFGHGYYFQVYFVIYDLAGHGLDVAGNTLGPNLWTDGLPDYDPTAAHPGYDASFSYFDELKNPLDQPFLLQMGDINIQKINISENVLINDQNIQSGYNITSIKQNITIRLILTVDPSNYQTVNISYRFIPIINGSINSSIEYKTFSMNLTNIIGDNYVYEFIIPSEELNFNTILDFYVYYNDGANNEYQSDPFIETDDDFNSSSNLNYCMDETSPVEVEEDTFTEVRKPNRNNEPNEIVTWTNETVTDFNVTHVIQDIDGTGLSNVTVNWYVNGSLVPSLQQEYMTNGNINWNNASYYFNGSYIFNVTAPSMFFSPNTTLTYDVSVTDLSGNSLTLNSIENENSNSFRFEEPPKPEIEEPEPLPDPEEIEEPATVIETIVTTDEEGNEVTIFNTTIIEPVAQEETNNALWIIAGFLGLLGLLTLYYQRHNIKDMIQQRRRRQKVKSVISDIIKEIRTLGEQEKYKRAVLLIWDALERISKEIVNSSRPFNVTAREFTAYLSTVTVVDRETLLTLSDTFESARYGKDNITKQVFENAINALENTIETIIKSGARSRVTNDDDDW